MKKNTYKKSDALGNLLSEEIGKGINEENLNKALGARTEMNTFRSTKEEKDNFREACNDKEPSRVLRHLMNLFTKLNK